MQLPMSRMAWALTDPAAIMVCQRQRCGGTRTTRTAMPMPEWIRGVPVSFFEEHLHSSNLRIFTMLDVGEVTSKCVLLPCMDY